MLGILGDHRGLMFNGHVRRARRVYRDKLSLAPGSSLQQLVDAIAELNRRPISIRHMPLHTGVSGLCLRGATEDRIVVADDNPAFARRRVVVHELGHLLPWYDPEHENCTISGHGEGHGSGLAPLILDGQITTLPPDLVEDVLDPHRTVKFRASFSSAEETAIDAWATVVARMLAPETTRSAPSGAITSAFANRSL
ncbi:hypothetical protein ABZ682_18715 [Streptomyces griseoviridis]|uniref:hypothetical protein n=1 Tax=Streptomyces griseoviridis TaxID=45398 RepID=UPI0034019F31